MSGKLVFPLRLRLWRIGDRMQPLGMTGTKLISDILIDQKRDRFAKESTWVLEDKLGIVLLGGYRIAQRVAGTVA
jgi:tRNA(Ile)-lysidine synthase